MRNLRSIVAVVPLLLVGAPLAAGAQPAPAEALDPVPVQRGEPLWSMGAGIGWGSILSGGLGSANVISTPGGLTFLVRAPGVGASVERRLGPGTWLALGVYGRTESRSIDGQPPSYAQETDLTEGAVTLGLRQVLTSPGAPMAISVLVLGEAGGARSATRLAGDNGDRDASRVAAVGAGVGVAVERELLDGLSVRLSTSVARASWWRARIDPSGGPAQHADGFSAGVQLAPSLELRLAF